MSILQFEDSPHYHGPLHEESAEQEVKSCRTVRVLLEESHEEAEAHEDHHVDVLKIWRKRSRLDNTAVHVTRIELENVRGYFDWVTSIIETASPSPPSMEDVVGGRSSLPYRPSAANTMTNIICNTRKSTKPVTEFPVACILSTELLLLKETWICFCHLSHSSVNSLPNRPRFATFPPR